MTDIEKNIDDVPRESSTEENLLGVGQRILGNLETIGGILMGDPITTAEGEFNATVGTAHQDSNRILTAIESEEAEENRRSRE